MASERSIIYIADNLRIDLAARRVWLDQNELTLPKLTFRFLLTLIRAEGKLVSYQQLIDSVWDGRLVSDDTITQRASLLRKQLTDNAEPYFEAVRGEGYRWLTPVSICSADINKKTDNTDVALTPTHETRALPEPSKSSTRYRYWLVAIIIIITLWQVLSPTNKTSSGIDSSLIQPQASSSLTLQKAQKYAREFNARSNTIAIDLYRQALVETPDSSEAKAGLALALLHAVSKFAADSAWLNEVDALSAKLLSTDDSAKHRWLRGFYFDVQGNLTQAIHYYQQALMINPDMSEVKGALAYLYMQKGRLVDAILLNKDTLGSQQEFQLVQMGDTLLLAGLDNDAGRWIRKAHQLSPDNAFTTISFAHYLVLQNKLEQALSLVQNLHQQGIYNDSSWVLVGEMYLLKNDLEKARTAFLKAKQLTPRSLYSEAWLAWLDHQQQKASASSELQALSQDDWPNLWVAQAIAHMANGQVETALSSLETSLRLGYLDHRWLMLLPPFRALHQDPHFIRIQAQMQVSAAAEALKIKQYTLVTAPQP